MYNFNTSQNLKLTVTVTENCVIHRKFRRGRIRSIPDKAVNVRTT